MGMRTFEEATGFVQDTWQDRKRKRLREYGEEVGRLWASKLANQDVEYRIEDILVTRTPIPRLTITAVIDLRPDIEGIVDCANVERETFGIFFWAGFGSGAAAAGLSFCFKRRSMHSKPTCDRAGDHREKPTTGVGTIIIAPKADGERHKPEIVTDEDLISESLDKYLAEAAETTKIQQVSSPTRSSHAHRQTLTARSQRWTRFFARRFVTRREQSR